MQHQVVEDLFSRLSREWLQARTKFIVEHVFATGDGQQQVVREHFRVLECSCHRVLAGRVSSWFGEPNAYELTSVTDLQRVVDVDVNQQPSLEQELQWKQHRWAVVGAAQRCERLIEDGRRLGLINERDVETWQMSRVVLPEAKELTLSMGALPVQLNLLMRPVWADGTKLRDFVSVETRQRKARCTYVTHKTMRGTRVQLDRWIELAAELEPLGKGYLVVNAEGQDILCYTLLDSDTGALRCRLAPNEQVDLDIPKNWETALEPTVEVFVTVASAHLGI